MSFYIVQHQLGVKFKSSKAKSCLALVIDKSMKLATPQ